MRPPRDYAAILSRHGLSPARPLSPSQDPDVLRRCVDILWGALGSSGISWLGFYQKAAGDEMVLVCREPGPACSPIGLHGACGSSWRSRRGLVVRDVRDLGEGYIACDPRDQSEVVVPVLRADGSCWGVLDADSHDVGSFDGEDLRGIDSVLVALGISRGVTSR